MVESSFDIDFMTLYILKLDFVFMLLEFIIYFEGIITKIWRTRRFVNATN